MNNVMDLMGLYSPAGIRLDIKDIDLVDLEARKSTASLNGTASHYEIGVNFAQPTFQKLFLQGMRVRESDCIRYLAQHSNPEIREPWGPEWREAEKRAREVYEHLDDCNKSDLRARTRAEIEAKLFGEEPEWVIWAITLFMDHINIAYHAKDDIKNTNMIEVWAENLTFKAVLKAHDEDQNPEYMRQDLTIDYAISGSGEHGNTRTLLARMYYGERQFSTLHYTLHAMDLVRQIAKDHPTVVPDEASV